VKLGVFVDQDTTRYCYLRLRRLKAAVKDPKIVDALAQTLEVAGVSGKQKMPAIERRIEELRRSGDSIWSEIPAPEVMAASMFKSRNVAPEVIDQLFARVARVQDLAAPLVAWLNLAGLTPYEGGAPGTGRANVVGYRGGAFLAGARIVGIEATNDVAALGNALDEKKPSREQTHASYIACTPALAAEFLWANASRAGNKRWDADALLRRLQASGCGLLLVEGDAVAQAILPKERRLTSAEIAQLSTTIHSTSKVVK